MFFRPLFALAVAGVVVTLLPGAHAAESGAGVPRPPAAAAEVRTWLMRIHDAASQRNFQGTFVVSGDGTVSSARIAHFCEGRNQFERSESLDGQARQVFRHNEWVYTVWPGKRLARVEQRRAPAAFPALLHAGDDRIVNFYDVTSQGTDRVAGHEADVLLITPKDTQRYGYRLWAERVSGLLLRADVLGAQHQVLETSAFSDVAIDVRPQPESVLQPIRKLDGYALQRPVLSPTRLDAEGWSLVVPVSGFQQVSCVRRAVDGMASGEPAASRPRQPAPDDERAEQIIQAIYSDGLTHVSVFIEAYKQARHGREMLASTGATQTLTKRQGDWWITLVGDVPPATLQLFANRLERRP